MQIVTNEDAGFVQLWPELMLLGWGDEMARHAMGLAEPLFETDDERTACVNRLPRRPLASSTRSVQTFRSAGLLRQIAERTGKALERRGLIERELQNAWLARDGSSGPLDDLIGHFITCPGHSCEP